MIPHRIPWHARTAPHDVAVVDETLDRTLTYAELADRIGRIAGYLRGRGIGRGDRVAVLARNGHHVLELQYACAALGAIFVSLNWRLSIVELRSAVDDCRPSLLVHEPSLAHELGIPAFVLDAGWELAVREAAAVAWGDVDDADPWCIVYTSGTTGTPKGVVISHSSARATMLSVVVASRITAETVLLTVLPYGGVNLFTNPTLFMGGTVVLLRDFEPARALAILLERDITHVCGVPAIFKFMQALPAWSSKRFDGLRIMIGGAPVTDGLIQAWMDRGARPRTVYGISEAGAAVLMVPDGEAESHLGTVGQPAHACSYSHPRQGGRGGACGNGGPALHRRTERDTRLLGKSRPHDAIDRELLACSTTAEARSGTRSSSSGTATSCRPMACVPSHVTALPVTRSRATSPGSTLSCATRLARF